MSLRASFVLLPALMLACSSAVPAPEGACVNDQAPREPAAPPAAAEPANANADARTALSVCWVESGRTVAPGGEATASGMLIRHPSGDLLVDAGDSTNYDQEIEPYTGADRAFYESVPALLKPAEPLPAVLRDMGVDPAGIKGFLPSHIHVDHVGGMMDMPDMPVYFVTAEDQILEQGLTETLFAVVPAHAKRLAPLAEVLPMDGPAYEGFATSRDFFGDGSLVVVPLPGHTPGSVGLFVTFADGTRLFHVGDAVDTLAQLAEDAPKSFPLAVTDSDPAQALDRVHDLHALAARRPALPLLPAHDRAAWQAIFGQPGACVTKTTGT